MAGPGQPVDAARVQKQVRDHLLLNFTDMGNYKDAEIPVFVRGEGCELIDVHGRRFIDGLSGLYCANLGHSFGAEIGAVAKAQMEELAYTSTWYVAHPRAAELAERIADLAPSGLERVYFTTGGGEANESMWKMVRNWHQANGQPQRTKAIARKTAYHGTSLGALSFTGIDFCRDPFMPMPIDVTHVSETNAYRHPKGDDPVAFTTALLEEMEQAILDAGPDEVALIIAEPVQNSGGCFTPPPGYWQGLRQLADKYGALLTADEVITGFGRTGEWFGSITYDIAPDFIVFAKGATAGMAPLGGVIVHDRVAEPFVTGKAFYNHGTTYSGHPVSAAIGSAVLDIYDREGVVENVKKNHAYLERRLGELRRIPLVGDVRGVGHFWALEMVKDRDTKQTFEGAEADWLLRQVLSQRLYDDGLLCRLDDRGDPVVQLSPPLIADEELLGRIVDIVGEAVEYAWGEVQKGMPTD
jgi:adenosylmethionine-8-amino-7-oxononanoate aminotransferase